MATYAIRLLKPASRELERLDKGVGTRVVRKLRWLAENLDNISPEPLKGRLRGSTSCVRATIELPTKYSKLKA